MTTKRYMRIPMVKTMVSQSDQCLSLNIVECMNASCKYPDHTTDLGLRHSFVVLRPFFNASNAHLIYQG